MFESELGRPYADGEVICRQGEHAHCMYVVQSGTVEVFHQEGGREVRVRELGRGEIFGEMGIIDRVPRSATVRARGEAWILTLDKRTFFRRIDKDPSLALEIIAGLSRRFRAVEEELCLLRNVLAEVRLVKFVVVVDRGRPELYERLRRDLVRDREVEVVLDRRRRSGAPPDGVAERRAEPVGWSVRPSLALRAARPALAAPPPPRQASDRARARKRTDR